MRHAHKVIAASALVMLGFTPRAALGADSWAEVKSAHFTVVSNAGERAGRSVAFDWEQLRIAIRAAWPWARLDLDRPLVVIAVNAEDDMKAFAPQYWDERGAVRPEAIATGGADQYSFLIRADLSKDDRNRTTNPYYSAYWTYVATVLDASVRRPLPLWVESGLAGIMANSIVGGQTLQIGRMMQGYVSTLHNREHPTVPDLLKIDRNSPWYQRADSREPFDAMAWAFTHFLLFGDEGAHRQKFQMFIDLLVSGKPQDEAWAASFGGMSAFTGAFAAYINRQTWPFSQINADMSVPPSSFAVRAMSAAEAASARARFLLEMNRPDDARTALEAAEKADPKCAAAYDVEGLLADRERRADDALEAYTRAMDLGSTDFYSFYRWTAANLPAAAKDADLRARVTTAAGRAAILNKVYPPSLAQLALVTRMNGNRDDAVAYAQRAAELAPDDANVRRVLEEVKR